MFTSGIEQILIDWGLPALLALSFLAATVLPLSSEWLLAILLLNHTNPALAVTIATLGNTLGAITTWWIGKVGGNWMSEKILRIGKREKQRAEGWYKKWGIWSLLLAWVPIVGDALCLVAGILRVPFLPFSLLVASGKCIRYIVFAWATLQISK